MRLFGDLLEKWNKSKAAAGPLPEAHPRPEADALPPEDGEGQQPAEEELEPRGILAPDTLLPALEGALPELWRLWREDDLPPPLSLARGMDPGSLPLMPEELEGEKKRLTEWLEAEAASRLEQLQPPEGEEGPPSADGLCRFWLSGSRMVAWGFHFPPVGEGEDLTPEAVARELRSLGISFGVDGQQVETLAETWMELIPVALGTLPTQGSNGRVVEHFQREIDRSVLIKEDGTVDYRAQKYVQEVRAGEVICDIIQPVPGVSGRAVDGTEAEPEKVSPALLPRGRNVNISSDGRQLVAAEAGHVVYTESNFNVMKVLEIDGDVNYANGNVDFPGDIHISGDVRDGFHIRAEGGILVDGLVEGARLDAGADIMIARGVVGDGRALIRCRGSLHAKFLENCEAYAGRCIYAECAVASRLHSDDSIYVDSGRGSVIGGVLTVGRGVKARSIGARSGRTTELKLGVESFVRQEIRELHAQLETLESEQTRAAEDLRYLESQGGQQAGDGRLAKARVRCSALALKGQKLNKKLERLSTREPDLAQCFVECDTMYPITRISIDERSKVIGAVWEDFKAGYDIETCELKIYAT